MSYATVQVFLFSNSSCMYLENKISSEKKSGKRQILDNQQVYKYVHHGFWKDMEKEKFGGNENQQTFPVHMRFWDI